MPRKHATKTLKNNSFEFCYNPSHGYDQQIFVSTVEDEFICPVCTEIFKDPVLCNCGCTFCRSCLVKTYNPSKTGPCPTCRAKIDPLALPPVLVLSKIIKEKPIRCCTVLNIESDETDGESQCYWIGTLNTIDKHLEHDCQFNTIKCPEEQCFFITQRRYMLSHIDNDCCYTLIPCPTQGCSVILQRQLLVRHVEKDCQYNRVPCLYCKDEFIRKDIKAHIKSCSLRPVPCTYNCGALMSKEATLMHEETCPMVPIPCPLYESEDGCVSSCSGEVIRSELGQHLHCSNMKLVSAYLKLLAERKGLPDSVTAAAPVCETAYPIGASNRGESINSGGQKAATRGLESQGMGRDGRYYGTSLPLLNRSAGCIGEEAIEIELDDGLYGVTVHLSPGSHSARAEVYVSSWGRKCVLVYSALTGHYKRNISSRKFEHPNALLLFHPPGRSLADTELFVSDIWSHKIFVFHAESGSLLRTIGDSKGPGKLLCPHGMVLYTPHPTFTSSTSSANNHHPTQLIVADCNNHCIKAFNAVSGLYLCNVVERKQNLENPVGVAIYSPPPEDSETDGESKLFVAYENNHLVHVYSLQTGIPLYRIGNRGRSRKANLSAPCGLAIFATDVVQLYVTDQICDRIQVYDALSQAHLRTIGQGSGLQSPTAISVFPGVGGLLLFVSQYRSTQVRVLLDKCPDVEEVVDLCEESDAAQPGKGQGNDEDDPPGDCPVSPGRVVGVNLDMGGTLMQTGICPAVVSPEASSSTFDAALRSTFMRNLSTPVRHELRENVIRECAIKLLTVDGSLSWSMKTWHRKIFKTLLSAATNANADAMIGRVVLEETNRRLAQADQSSPPPIAVEMGSPADFEDRTDAIDSHTIATSSAVDQLPVALSPTSSALGVDFITVGKQGTTELQGIAVYPLPCSDLSAPVEVFVADGASKQVLVYDSHTGQLLRAIGENCLLYPTGVACCVPGNGSVRATELFVADAWRRVMVFDVDTGELLRSMETDHPEFLEGLCLYDPHRGVETTAGDMLLLAAGQSCINSYNAATGQFVRQVVDLSQWPGIAPIGIAVHAPVYGVHMVFVSLKGDQYVRVFDILSGEHLHQFFFPYQNHASDVGRLSSPCGLTVCEYKGDALLFVTDKSDSENGFVHVFDINKRQHLRYFGNGCGVEFKSPCGVAAYPNAGGVTLFVTQNQANQMRVLTYVSDTESVISSDSSAATTETRSAGEMSGTDFRSGPRETEVPQILGYIPGPANTQPEVSLTRNSKKRKLAESCVGVRKSGRERANNSLLNGFVQQSASRKIKLAALDVQEATDVDTADNVDCDWREVTGGLSSSSAFKFARGRGRGRPPKYLSPSKTEIEENPASLAALRLNTMEDYGDYECKEADESGAEDQARQSSGCGAGVGGGTGRRCRGRPQRSITPVDDINMLEMDPSSAARNTSSSSTDSTLTDSSATSPLRRIGAGRLGHPSGLALYSAVDGTASTLFVADAACNRVDAYDSLTGELLYAIGSYGKKPGQLLKPHAVLTHTNELFVADSYNHRVQVFEIASRRYVRSISHASKSTGKKFLPMSMVLHEATPTTKVLFVADWEGSVEVFNAATGRHLQSIGADAGAGPGRMIRPWGLALHGDTSAGEQARLFVCDNCSRKVNVFDATCGEYLHTAVQFPVDRDYCPYGILVSEQAQGGAVEMYVATGTTKAGVGRVHVVNPDTGDSIRTVFDMKGAQPQGLAILSATAMNGALLFVSDYSRGHKCVFVVEL